MTQSEYSEISNFVKYSRRRLNITQQELAKKAGVGLRFIRDLEQGKTSLRMDKVNQVIELFGYRMTPRTDRILDAYEILLKHFNQAVRIVCKDKKTLYGIIIEAISTNNEITGWKYIPNNKAIEYLKTKNRASEAYLPHADIETIENIADSKS